MGDQPLILACFGDQYTLHLCPQGCSWCTPAVLCAYVPRLPDLQHLQATTPYSQQQVFACQGWAHTLVCVFSAEGSVWGRGWNAHGQMGQSGQQHHQQQHQQQGQEPGPLPTRGGAMLFLGEGAHAQPARHKRVEANQVARCAISYSDGSSG